MLTTKKKTRINKIRVLSVISIVILLFSLSSVAAHVEPKLGSVTIISPSDIVVGDPVTFEADVRDCCGNPWTHGGLTYKWTFGDYYNCGPDCLNHKSLSKPLTDASPTVTFYHATNYPVTVQVSYGCQMVEDTKSVTVDLLVIPPMEKPFDAGPVGKFLQDTIDEKKIKEIVDDPNFKKKTVLEKFIALTPALKMRPTWEKELKRICEDEVPISVQINIFGALMGAHVVDKYGQYQSGQKVDWLKPISDIDWRVPVMWDITSGVKVGIKKLEGQKPEPVTNFKGFLGLVFSEPIEGGKLSIGIGLSPDYHHGRWQVSDSVNLKGEWRFSSPSWLVMTSDYSEDANGFKKVRSFQYTDDDLSFGFYSASDQQVILPAETRSHMVYVDATASLHEFSIGYEEGNLGLAIYKPDGTKIDESNVESYPNITYVEDIIENVTYKHYMVETPDPGNWIMKVVAISVPDDGAIYTVEDLMASDIVLLLLTDKHQYRVNDSANITAHLASEGIGITGADVEAGIERPDGTIDAMILYDDGTHGDAAANDGNYSNVYSDMVLEGPYHIIASATGTVNLEQFFREASITIGGCEFMRDSDNDGIPDVYDNCWYVFNHDQADTYGINCSERKNDPTYADQTIYGKPWIKDPQCGDACEVSEVPVVPTCGENHTEGIISYWKLDDSGDAGKDALNNNPGTNYGATYTSIGQVNGAYSFDGSDDYINVDDDPSLRPTSITVEAWAKRTGSLSSNARIVSKWDVDESYGLWVVSDAWNNIMGIQVEPWTVLYSNVSMALNEWYHIVGTFDANQQILRIYINGEEKNNVSFSGIDYGTSHELLNIGRRANGQEYFNGLIDEVAIYNRALSADEIYQHYINGINSLQYCTPAPPAVECPEGMISYYTFDDGTANDFWGIKNGTKVGDPTTITGKVGNALLFDGIDDYIQLPYFDVFNQKPFTVEGWFKIKSWCSPDEQDYFFTSGDRNAKNEHLILLVNPATHPTQPGIPCLAFYVDDDCATQSLNLDQWYHLVFVWEGPSTKKQLLYINGELKASRISDGLLTVTSGSISGNGAWIVRRGDSYSNIIADEVAIYNRTLTVDKIADHYNSGLGRNYCIVVPDTTPPTIESVVLDANTTIPDATIHVTVEATDNVGVTSVTADGIALVETGSTWEGDITAPSAIGDYTLTIRAEDAVGNFAETTVDYSVVRPEGGLAVAVLPLFSNVIAGDTVDLTVKIISTENFDDKLHVYLSTEGLDNPADLSWFEWTNLNEVLICCTDFVTQAPSIYEDKIVYEDERNRNRDIYMYDLSTDTERQITTDPAWQGRPDIYGDKIVYDDFRNGNWDVYMYDLSTDTEKQITTDPASQVYPEIHRDKIVYSDGNIYMYDLSTDTEKQITTDPASQWYPDIYGDKIVWQDNGNWDIYMYDLSTDTEKQITTDPAKQWWPDIYGDKIVWQDFRNGNWDIYMYDLSTDTEKQITTDPANQEWPDIYGDKIVWLDFRNREGGMYGDGDIYMYDLSTDTEKQITTSTAFIGDLPKIYGDKIVGAGLAKHSWNIYMYDLSGIKIPARGEITIPLRAEIPTGESGIKMFRVNVESLIWRTEGFGTGMFGIT